MDATRLQCGLKPADGKLTHWPHNTPLTDHDLTGHRCLEHRYPRPGSTLDWTSTVRKRCEGEGEEN